MKIGLVGLGKMGGNMRERLRAGGIEVVGYDRNPEVSDVESLEAMHVGAARGERVERPRVTARRPYEATTPRGAPA